MDSTFARMPQNSLQPFRVLGSGWLFRFVSAALVFCRKEDEYFNLKVHVPIRFLNKCLNALQ